MIGKVQTGGHFKGAISYNSKGEVIDKNVMSDEVNKQVKEMKIVANQNDRAKNKVKHFIISFSEEDKNKLDDYTMTQIGQNYLNRMGYGNNQYITFKHADTRHLHMHIVTNRIDLDGKAVKDGKEKYKSRNIIRQLEKEYNLTQTPQQSKTKATKKNTQAYKAAEQRLNEQGNKTDKQLVKEKIKMVIKKKPISEGKFSSHLRNYGVKLHKNKAGNGYTFEYNDRHYKASNIDRSMSYSRLQQEFEKNLKNLQQEQKKQQKEDINSNQRKDKDRGMDGGMSM